MQTCKELRLVCCLRPKLDFSTKLSIDDMGEFTSQDIVIPSGTYVKKTFDQWNPNEKMYRVMPWRGMLEEYKEMVEDGVIITHKQVKGKY